MPSGADDLLVRYRLLAPWIKAIKRNFIVENNIKFEEVPCGNDTRFSALCGYYAQKVSIIPIVGYCWMTRKDSLWRSVDINWCRTRIGVNLRIAKYMKDHHAIGAFESFKEDTILFISKIRSFSIWQHWIEWFKYGVSLKDWKVLFIKLPQLFAHNVLNVSIKFLKGIRLFIYTR